MKTLDRQGFLKLAGAGSAVAATAALPIATTADAATRILTLRAVAQLPAEPLAGYASYVLSGHVDIARRTGTLSRTVFAGPPEAMSMIALPGLSRTIRVTDVRESGAVLHITGLVDDRSQLEKGESPHIAVHIHRVQGRATVRFGDTVVRLRLDNESE